MTHALLDPIGGLAGDMLLGAVVDLGADPDALRDSLASLGLEGLELKVEATSRRHIGCTWARPVAPDQADHRHLPEILARIEGAALLPAARRQAIATFRLLAEAEAQVHRIAPDEVHFHEVGAADAMGDIVGVCQGLALLGVERIFTTPLPLGRGQVECDHGTLPVPAPATLELLAGFPLQATGLGGETVTPTGAALLSAWGEPLPRGTTLIPQRAGYGAGTRPSSLLRLSLVEVAAPPAREETVLVLEAHLDDTRPEALGFLLEALMDDGALDVAYSPLVMKKSRPGVALTCIAPLDRGEALRQRIFRESTTLGLRQAEVRRHALERQHLEVETRFGRVRAVLAGGRLRPEYEDCARVAREHAVPLEEVYEEVRRGHV